MTEQKNCPFCHEDAEGYVTPLEKNCHAFIGRTLGTPVLVVKAKGWRGEVKVNYCPICGRKL